jgi:hypothetical protein
MRSLEEAVMLVEHMGHHLEAAGAFERAAVFFAKARDLERGSKSYRDDVLRHESLSGDNLGRTKDA